SDLTAALGLQRRAVFPWHLGDEEYRALAVPLRSTPWSYVVALPVSTFDAAARDFLRNATVTALLALLVASIVVVLFARHVAATLKEVTVASLGLARGDLNQHITMRSKDELGQMADAFRRLIAHLRHLSMVANGIARGELTVNVHPQSDDDVLGHALRQMAHDVRERDEQVRRSEAHFRSLIENASDVITVIDPDGKIRYESPSVERVLGYRAEELVGRDFYTPLHPHAPPPGRPSGGARGVRARAGPPGPAAVDRVPLPEPGRRVADRRGIRHLRARPDGPPDDHRQLARRHDPAGGPGRAAPRARRAGAAR